MRLTLVQLTPELLREVLEYNHLTGEFRWLPRPGMKVFNSRFAGRPAFTSRNNNGYYCGSVFSALVLAHRIAWVMYYGDWPSETLDHINGNTSDNRIANLRAVDHSTNMRNCARPTRNKSGVAGVIWNKRDRRWQVQIRTDGHQTHIGNFESFDDAVAARKAAERRYGYHPNHGREPRASAA